MNAKMGISLVVGVVIIGGALWSVLSKEGDNVQNTEEDQIAEEAMNTSNVMLEEVSEQDPEEVLEIQMTAKQWSFDPSEIRLKKGQKVRLHITSEDVRHSLYAVVGEQEIYALLEPGQQETIEFTAMKSGEFMFVCMVQCGRGHSDMVGKIIVEDI